MYFDQHCYSSFRNGFFIPVISPSKTPYETVWLENPLSGVVWQDPSLHVN